MSEPMELKKNEYVVSKETLKMVLDALSAHWFSYGDDDEYRNEEVIAADEALQAEIEAQQ